MLTKKNTLCLIDCLLISQGCVEALFLLVFTPTVLLHLQDGFQNKRSNRMPQTHPDFYFIVWL